MRRTWSGLRSVSVRRESNQVRVVRQTVSRMRILLLATWGVYPIAYIIPLYFSHAGADAWVAKQVGYSIADILAKVLYGLLIYKIARLKSFADDPEFAAAETEDEDHVLPAPANGRNTAKVLAGQKDSA